jgi:hypothetical protein
MRIQPLLQQLHYGAIIAGFRRDVHRLLLINEI